MGEIAKAKEVLLQERLVRETACHKAVIDLLKQYDCVLQSEVLIREGKVSSRVLIVAAEERGV